MPVKKAFTLIEIIIVILLVGILYALVLSNYTKKATFEAQSIEDIPSFMEKSGYTNGTLYIYGDFCQKGVFIDDKNKISKVPNFQCPKDGLILKLDTSDKFIKNRQGYIKIDKKSKKLCFSLKYVNGKFHQKEIVAFKKKWYLLKPFWQKIEKFDSLEKAKTAYRNDILYPESEDSYYCE